MVIDFAFGQRWAQYDCEIKFKINKSINKTGIIVEKLDFLIEEEYTQSEYIRPSISYDTISEEFIFEIVFMTLAAYYYIEYKCPEIYINVKFYNTEKLIPIYFECVQGIAGRQQYNLGLIDLNYFLLPILKKEDEVHLIEMPSYEIIEVKGDKSLHKRRKDEYELRKINKLVPLKLKSQKN